MIQLDCAQIPILPVALGIWAGVSLGGSLVAAPAKFRAPSLEMTTALEVGRAQFLWVGITEAILCIGIIASLLLWPVSYWKWMTAPIALFALQRLAVMPALDTRTLEVISGAPAGETHLHIVYIILEILKFVALITAAFISLRSLVTST